MLNWNPIVLKNQFFKCLYYLLNYYYFKNTEKISLAELLFLQNLLLRSYGAIFIKLQLTIVQSYMVLPK